jgi:hypothetical protein
MSAEHIPYALNDKEKMCVKLVSNHWKCSYINKK